MYADRGSATLLADVFEPAERHFLRPAVLCIHGGGWVSGDKSYMHEVADLLANEGFVAICPQYRFAPAHRFPAAVEDVQACVAYFRAHSEEFGIDSSRMASLGNSSGGHLAAMAGLTCGLQAVVDICGISDLVHAQGQHYAIGAAFVFEFLGATPDEAPQRYAEASPIQFVGKEAPPFLIVHGDQDDVVPIEQSEWLRDALANAGAKVEYHALAGESHSFSYGAWSTIEALFIDFLKRTLRHE